MPTASIYYRYDGALDRLFLGGQVADLIPQPGEDSLTTVTRTLAGLTAAGCTGWQPADDSLPRIIRQADGRGTIAVKPLHDALTQATVYINVRRGGQPYRVAVDGRVTPVATETSLASRLPGPAIDVIDGALVRLGYRRVSGIRVDTQPDGDKGGIWVCTAEAQPGQEWRDEPTLVRISNDAARAITALSTKLGIPGDTLTDKLLLWAARRSDATHARWSEKGYIEDHSRITGWDPLGFPHLKD